MLYIKRYDLLKSGEDTFKLKYKDHVIWLKSHSWKDAEDEANEVIDKLRKENKDKQVAIVWD